jgi:hypothetical protein
MAHLFINNNTILSQTCQGRRTFSILNCEISIPWAKVLSYFKSQSPSKSSEELLGVSLSFSKCFERFELSLDKQQHNAPIKVDIII